VRIVGNKPRLRRGVVYSLLTPETAARWYEPGGFGDLGARMAEIKPRRVPAWVLEAEKRGKTSKVKQFFFAVVDDQFVETNPDSPWQYLKRNIACMPGLRAISIHGYIVPSAKLADWFAKEEQFIGDVPPELLVQTNVLVGVVPPLYRTAMEPLRDVLYQAMIDRGAQELVESYRAGFVTPLICTENEWEIDDPKMYLDYPTKKRKKKVRRKKRARKR
jgi:hypothetical protein